MMILKTRKAVAGVLMGAVALLSASTAAANLTDAQAEKVQDLTAAIVVAVRGVQNTAAGESEENVQRRAEAAIQEVLASAELDCAVFGAAVSQARQTADTDSKGVQKAFDTTSRAVELACRDEYQPAAILGGASRSLPGTGPGGGAGGGGFYTPTN